MTDRAMSPAERAARQMLADKKEAEAAQRAYERSLTNTPVAPATPASSPVERKFSGGVTGGDSKSSPIFGALFGGKGSDPSEEARNAAKASSSEGKAMKNGGQVSASRRADGIAQRGKTRGRMI